MAKISGLRNKNALEMGIETGQLSFLKHRISPAMAKASPTRLIRSEGRLSMMGSQGESGTYSIGIPANRISAIPCN